MIFAEAETVIIPWQGLSAAFVSLGSAIAFLYSQIAKARKEGQDRADKYETKCETLLVEVSTMRAEIDTTKKIREEIGEMPETMQSLHDSVMEVLHDDGKSDGS